MTHAIHVAARPQGTGRHTSDTGLEQHGYVS